MEASKRSELQARITEKSVVDADGCWRWTACLDRDGYGRVGADGFIHMAHRLSLEVFTGNEIPPGLQVDHLCRNRACVNPDHLEAVTPRENTLRSQGVSAIHAKKTHCIHDHEFTPENTYQTGNRRCCRTCQREAARRYAARRRAQEVPC